jgi:acyl-CoA synthetase (AMP-forming)/AMP-acid ligase II
MGLKPRDRVLLLAVNPPEFFAELLAVWIGGGTTVPMDAALTSFRLKNLTTAAEPRFLIATGHGDTPSRVTATGRLTDLGGHPVRFRADLQCRPRRRCADPVPVGIDQTAQRRRPYASIAGGSLAVVGHRGVSAHALPAAGSISAMV